MAQQAWYKRYEEYRDEALRYMEVLRRIEQGSLQDDELRSFARYADITLIFESNTIEKAGTKTKGETREIIEKYFPQIPDDYRFFRALTKDFPDYVSKEKLVELFSALQQQQRVLIPSISFQNKSRSIGEVLRHQAALVRVSLIVTSLKMSAVQEILVSVKELLDGNDPPLPLERLNLNSVLEVKELLDNNDPLLPELMLFIEQNEVINQSARKQLFTEIDIFNLHYTLAEGLMPGDAEIEAGNYRIHDIEIVGVDVKFPSPKLVPQAMAKFIEDSNSRVDQVLAGKWDEFIMVAAEVSYNFVRIHPFPDFNGRMSRLLLAMTLRVFGVPFNLALRGSVAKYRNRYFYSLKRANNGNLKPYATLIAMRLVESFREIDENLRLAGQKTLLELEKTDTQ